MPALRYLGFPLILLAAVSQLANAQSPSGGSPAYASFGAGIGATAIRSADLDNDGDMDLVLGGGSGFGGNAFWSIVAFNHTTREYEISWQSAPYTPAAITALRIVEEGNARRVWIGLSDGRIDVVDGSTRELVDTLTTGSEAISDLAVADADNDGAIDVVVATSSRLLLYDPVTLSVAREFPYGGSLVAPLAYIVAGSYAQAEASGFVIDTTNPLGAKVAATFLAVSNTEWHDVVNNQAGTLIGNPTIGQDATGRYVQFDGVDDIIDMGRSYSRGPSAPMSGLANVGNGTHSMVGLYDWDTGSTDGNVVAERDGTSSTGSVFQHVASGDTAIFRGGTTNVLYATGITSGIRLVGYSRHGTDARVDGYIDGVPQNLGDTLSNFGSDVEVNLSFGGYWNGYPVSSNEARYRGKLYLMVMFNEALDDDEQASLATNPWQIFRAAATDMTITADAIESPVNLGDDATVVFNVSNLGTVDATNVLTEVELPEAVALASIESTAGTCSGDAGNQSCEIGTIPAGSTRTVTVIATAIDTGEALFNAWVFSDVDDNAANDSVAVSLTIAAVDLVVGTLPVTEVGLNQRANIRAGMDNRSTLDASDVEFVISLGQGLRAVSATWSLGSCTVVPQQMKCVSDNFAAQGSAAVDFDVMGTATGPQSYTVSVSAAEEDFDITDNSRNGTVIVNAPAVPGESGGGGSVGLLFLWLMSFAALLARYHHVVKMATWIRRTTSPRNAARIPTCIT
jgi:hypothetical protein